ncbi:MAG: hypothetical protein AB7E52_07870, partial [Bdellovibrionales bacterium]
MKRTWMTGIIYYTVAPFVVIGVLIAFGLTLSSSYENYRLGQATDQVIRILSLAKEMRISPDDSAQRLAESFFTRMEHDSPNEVVNVSPDFLDKGVQKGIKNP